MPYSGSVSDMSTINAIVFSDLDGTLLDHHDYSFAAALPALRVVDERRIPLILTTSKTLAEVEEINRLLQNPQAAIVENGCAMCFPPDRDFGFEFGPHERIDGYAVKRSPPDYRAIRDFIVQQRTRHRYRLQGFGDMNPEQLRSATGLSLGQAANAGKRLCSEPFQWLDSEERLQQFLAAAEEAGLCTTRGGRFWHLMGKSSKALALEKMRTLITAGQRGRPTVIALGDSENDRGMLQQADIAVVIRRHDGTHLDCRGKHRTIYTQQQGPAGWNAAILQILTEPGSLNPPNRGD